jgi:hypothetical protein
MMGSGLIARCKASNKSRTRHSHPLADPGSRLAGGDFPVGGKAPEVVEAHEIDTGHIGFDTRNPTSCSFGLYGLPNGTTGCPSVRRLR